MIKKVISFDRKKLWHIVITFIALLFAMVLLGLCLVYFNQDRIKNLFISEINKHLDTEVQVGNIDVSFLRSFPMASLVFENVLALDAYPDKTIKKDTLFFAKRIGLRFNVRDIIRGEYRIKKVDYQEGKIKLKTLKDGSCNYIFWKNSTGRKQKEFSLALNSISFSKVDIEYRNDISRIYLSARIKESKAKGNFSDTKQDIDLHSELTLNTFIYDKLILQGERKVNIDLKAGNDTQAGLFNIRNGRVELDEMRFDLSGTLEYKEDNLIDAKLTGHRIQLSEFASMFGQKASELLSDYKSEGVVNFVVDIKGETSSKKMPHIKADFNISDGRLSNRKLGIDCRNVSFSGHYTNGAERNSSTSSLIVKNLNADFPEGFVKGEFSLVNFSRMYIEADIKAKADLEKIRRFLKQDSIINLKGTAEVNLRAKGHGLKNVDMEGFAKINDLYLKDLRLKNMEFEKTDCELVFNRNSIQINKLQGLFNKATLNAKGNYRNSTLLLDFDLSQYTKDKLQLNDINAKLTYSKGIISFGHLNFKAFDGKISSDKCSILLYKDHAIISGEAALRNINLEKLFIQTDNFNQKAITDKNINGILSADASFNLYFDKEFRLVLDRSSLNMDYNISEGRLKNMSFLKKLSYFAEESALSNVRFDNIKSSFQLNNSCINFNPVKIGSNTVSFDFAGKHYLDNRIDYRFSIKLSELTSKKKKAKLEKQQEEFGRFEKNNSSRLTIFIKVGGTLDKPVFSYDAKSNMQQMKEQISKDKKDIMKAMDKDLNLNMEQRKEDKINWERQEKGEFLIEWEEKNDTVKTEKHFEDSDISVEWE